ncbi:MAG TPA: hypothetical protein VFV58_25605 [Blastocatellia bacterium]|jgi:hypothetical protein|nr:hypothetical protein [Blastocatellia bacterium]
MLKKLSMVGLFIFFSVASVSGDTAGLSAPQDALVELRDNNCVNCHARLSTPLRMTTRYAEWRITTHKERESRAGRSEDKLARLQP